MLLATILLLLGCAVPCECCFLVFNRQWKPVSLEERTRKADLVVTANILSTSPIPDNRHFYEATFEVLNVLKGWDLLKKLHSQGGSGPVKFMEPKIVASAYGFGDQKLCFSHVEVGESYALFLSFDHVKRKLVAKYDDIFGAADKLWKRTERDILKTLGWEEWSSWTQCSRKCGKGIQKRHRECRKMKAHYECHGPTEEKRNCNTFACSETYDILQFILDQGKSPFSSWRNGQKDVFKNSINQLSPAKAPTYLLIDRFPLESVLHISFKGPVKDTQFLHSIYDANNRLQLGIIVSRYTFAFTYDKRIDMGTKSRQAMAYTHSFAEPIWYNMAIHFKKNELIFRVNCEEEHRAFISEDILKNFDVYGQMYLGADKEEEEQKAYVRVEVGSILISKQSKSLNQQCGPLALGTPLKEQKEKGKGNENEEGSGKSGVLSGPDDSESGDVDDEDNEEGSGASKIEECRCKNGGVCKDPGTCSCPRGWEGRLCEQAMCTNKCLNEGKCIAPNKCKCQSLTSGSYCQFHECPISCKNGGKCIGLNRCRCKEGFEGSHCQYESCAKRCLNGGRCIKNGRCICKRGFKGEKCQFAENCTQFVTKTVKYTKPAIKIVYFNEEVPCEDNKSRTCLKKKSRSQAYETTGYRQIYVCKS